MSRRALVNYVGAAILVLGMGAGEFLYWHATRNATEDAGTSPYDSKVFHDDMERNVGAFGLLMYQLAHVADTPGLAIGVTSLALAGGCFLAASRMPRE
jgi:hypothetical protein